MTSAVSMQDDPYLGEVHRAYRERAREALAGFDGWARRRRHGELAEEVWRAFAGAGLLGALVPPEHGGDGAGLLALSVALEELGAVGLPSMLPILTAVDTLAIARHGEAALQTRWLPRLAGGDARLAIAMTEAEAGFNTFQITTRAELVGEVYRLDGEKIYISGLDQTDAMLVLARSIPLEDCRTRRLPKTAGLTLLLVAGDSAGIEKHPLATHGEGTLRQFAVRFDGVEVPAGQRIGAESEATPILLELINPERVLVSALLVGVSRYCLAVASRHARTRAVFGDTPIGSYQSVQHPLAEAQVHQEATRLMTHRAAAAVDGGAPLSVQGHAANGAKLLAAELGRLSLDAALNALGGKGFDEDYGLIHLLELVELLRIAPISRGLILNRVAEEALGLPRSY